MRGNIGRGQNVAHADRRQRGQAEVNQPSGVNLVGAGRGLPAWRDDAEAPGIKPPEAEFSNLPGRETSFFNHDRLSENNETRYTDPPVRRLYF
jgi:hypothetical protein